MATCSISFPGKPMDRGAWQTTVHGLTESDGGRATARGCWAVGGPPRQGVCAREWEHGVPAAPQRPGLVVPCKDGDSPGLPREPQVPCEGVSLRPSMKPRVAATRHPESASPLMALGGSSQSSLWPRQFYYFSVYKNGQLEEGERRPRRVISRGSCDCFVKWPCVLRAPRPLHECPLDGASCERGRACSFPAA